MTALDGEFRRMTLRYIDEALGVYRSAYPSDKIQEVWKCSKSGDFLCGFFAGHVTGSALSAVQAMYGRQPTTEEQAEITEMVESRAAEIRQAVSGMGT